MVTMKANPTCRVCNVVLDSENWYASRQKQNDYICKKCKREQLFLWRKANPDKMRLQWERSDRKRGKQPYNKNKECAQYLGIHVAERVLSHAFKDVIRMPMNNPGYDVTCNMGKKIDIKSSCKRKNGSWTFTINRNTTADFFLCIAFGDREELTPLHVWLIPGSKLNHLKHTAISKSTIHKWDEYRLDITKISQCCEMMRK